MSKEDPPVDMGYMSLPAEVQAEVEHNVAMRTWQFAVSILPAANLDADRTLWTACCAHPDHPTWTSAPHSAGTAAVALQQHWRAKHVQQ